MNSSKEPGKPTAGFCAICGGHHDPDVPCFDQTQQALKYLHIPKNQQIRRLRDLHKWAKMTARLMLIGAAIILILSFILGLFSSLGK